MIIHDVQQNTEAWSRLRAGIPTASAFDKIFTPGGKQSRQAESYMHHLLAEFLIGQPIVSIQTEWMQRGHILEEKAVAAYEFHTDRETKRVGFITTDDLLIGASPDRLVGEDRLLELKCPKHNTQVSYMLTGRVEDEYKPQLQGQLWISGRDVVDIIAYHPELSHVIISVPRDEKYIGQLSDAVAAFVEVMLMKRAELLSRFGKPDRSTTMPAVEIDDKGLGFDLSDNDVSRIWEHAASQPLTQQ